MSQTYYVGIKREDVGHVVKYCPDIVDYQQGELSFGKVDIKEKNELGATPDDWAGLGSIRMSYQRIWYGAMRRRDNRSAYRFNSRISEVSEKIRLRTLQMLGCMPRSPSPEPIHDDIAIREELAVLGARLAEVERNARNASQPNIKSERTRVESGVKRERDDKENRASRKRNRRIETIYLTDD
ncbi:MAG: hypothetical protein Q9210_001245 [Variospora velana]